MATFEKKKTLENRATDEIKLGNFNGMQFVMLKFFVWLFSSRNNEKTLSNSEFFFSVKNVNSPVTVADEGKISRSTARNRRLYPTGDKERIFFKQKPLRSLGVLVGICGLKVHLRFKV